MILDTVFIEIDSDIFRIRDELDRPEHRTMRNTARDRNGCRLFAIDCNKQMNIEGARLRGARANVLVVRPPDSGFDH